MTFKEQIASDISVFLNSDEFGDTHNINGVDVTCIIDNDLLQQNSRLQGVYLGDKLIQIATTEFNAPISAEYDEIITFDSESFRVLKVEEYDGISEVYLSKDLGDRFIIVKYRLKAGIGANQDLGIPATKQDWSLASSIDPNPIFKEIKNEFKQSDIGIIKAGDVLIKVNKTLFTRSDLESYEYQLNNRVYTLINGQIIEDAYFWQLYLRAAN